MTDEFPEPPPVKCPKCGSTQITAGKHGFSAGKAVGGALLTGGIGLLAGMHGSKKIEITCLNCGNKFKPGANLVVEPKEQKVEKLPNEKESTQAMGCLAVFVVVIVVYFLFFR